MDISGYYCFCLSQVAFFYFILCVLNHSLAQVQIKNITGTIFCEKDVQYGRNWSFTSTECDDLAGNYSILQFHGSAGNNCPISVCELYTLSACLMKGWSSFEKVSHQRHLFSIYKQLMKDNTSCVTQIHIMSWLWNVSCSQTDTFCKRVSCQPMTADDIALWIVVVVVVVGCHHWLLLIVSRY